MSGPHVRTKADLERIEEVCATHRALAEARVAGVLSLLSFAVSRRAAIRDMVLLVRALPRIDVSVGAGDAGAEIVKHLAVRHRGRHVNRRAVGVLALPDDPEVYLQGTKRRGARANLREAEALGLTFRELPDAATTRVEAARILKLHRDEFWDAEALGHAVARRTSRVFVVEDGERAVRALAAVVVDEAWAHMYLCISDRSEASHAALYLLNVGVIKQLSVERVRYVFVSSAFHLTPGQRYLQARLGFELMNLRLARPSSRSASPGRARRRERLPIT
ncbi:MAG: hypothetical protein ABSA40_10270 [Candidatus Dormibacteria bacterium]